MQNTVIEALLQCINIRTAWMFVCCECCVLSGRGLCDGLITRPEESYWLWRVVVCDLETSKMRRLKPATGLWKIQPQWTVKQKKKIYIYKFKKNNSPVNKMWYMTVNLLLWNYCLYATMYRTIQIEIKHAICTFCIKTFNYWRVANII